MYGHRAKYDSNVLVSAYGLYPSSYMHDIYVRGYVIIAYGHTTAPVRALLLTWPRERI